MLAEGDASQTLPIRVRWAANRVKSFYVVCSKQRISSFRPDPGCEMSDCPSARWHAQAAGQVGVAASSRTIAKGTVAVTLRNVKVSGGAESSTEAGGGVVRGRGVDQ